MVSMEGSEAKERRQMEGSHVRHWGGASPEKRSEVHRSRAQAGHQASALPPIRPWAGSFL